MFAALLAALATAPTAQAQEVASPPAVGDQAATLRLNDADGLPVDLGDVFAEGKTVLVVLRGYPGYQCGICSRQAAAFFQQANRFAEAGVDVVMVYPGPASDLGARANEFVVGVTKGMDEKKIPAGITMLLDPEYILVDAYGLRWDAPNETAYPATFVVAEGGQITFARVSDGHGGRIDAQTALAAATD